MAQSVSGQTEDLKVVGSIPGTFISFDDDYAMLEMMWMNHRIKRMAKMELNAKRRKQKRKRTQVINDVQDRKAWLTEATE